MGTDKSSKAGADKVPATVIEEEEVNNFASVENNKYLEVWTGWDKR